MFGQIRHHQELDALLFENLIMAKVPTAHVGIDRYLRGIARSRRQADKVYGGSSALFLYVGYGFVGNG